MVAIGSYTATLCHLDLSSCITLFLPFFVLYLSISDESVVGVAHWLLYPLMRSEEKLQLLMGYYLMVRLEEKRYKMMVEDLGVEAKESAVREVAKLLPLPELLQSISSIKSDYIARQQVEQAQAGLDSLNLSQKSINQLRENFLSIEKLCTECQNLIENHDQIKLLSNARNNLNTTLKDIDGMMSISVEAAEARDSLSDDKELINTYERLTALDGKRRFALAAAASHKEEVGRL
ncbi:hypothetical protein CRG98_017198, partial [Punica granatum]